MRFMMLVILPADLNDADYAPKAEDAGRMTRFNEDLTRAGVLLALDGLHPASKGARVTFDAGGRPTVTDGPFSEAKELVGGYWVIQVKSKEEAVEWASRVPFTEGAAVEVRQVFEMADFEADVQAAAGELSQVPPEQTSA